MTGTVVIFSLVSYIFGTAITYWLCNIDKQHSEKQSAPENIAEELLVQEINYAAKSKPWEFKRLAPEAGYEDETSGWKWRNLFIHDAMRKKSWRGIVVDRTDKNHFIVVTGESKYRNQIAKILDDLRFRAALHNLEQEQNELENSHWD